MELAGGSWDYVVVFWGGVLVSFTPCLYPVLPITASVIAGANTGGKKAMGFVLSLLYVLGMALAYCGLAVMAVFTGRVMGQIQNLPIFDLINAVVLFVFGLVMLDKILIPVIGIDLRGRIQARHPAAIFVIGFSSGLVLGPCLTPVLGTLLYYLAYRQDLWRAVSLMFVFSYGLGASLIIVGTFSGILANLPKSGLWLARVKQFCAVALFVLSIHFFIQGLFKIISR